MITCNNCHQPLNEASAVCVPEIRIQEESTSVWYDTIRYRVGRLTGKYDTYHKSDVCLPRILNAANPAWNVLTLIGSCELDEIQERNFFEMQAWKNITKLVSESDTRAPLEVLFNPQQDRSSQGIRVYVNRKTFLNLIKHGHLGLSPEDSVRPSVEEVNSHLLARGATLICLYDSGYFDYGREAESDPQFVPFVPDNALVVLGHGQPEVYILP